MTTANQLSKAIEAVVHALGASASTPESDGLIHALGAVARTEVGEHLVYCLHIDLARGRLTADVKQRITACLAVATNLADLSGGLDTIADRFEHVAHSLRGAPDNTNYAAVWSTRRCWRTFVPPTRAGELLRFEEFLNRKRGVRFSQLHHPVVSADRPVGWVTDRDSSDVARDDAATLSVVEELIEVLGLPWPAGTHSTCLVVFPSPLQSHANLGVPTALASRWDGPGLYVSNDKVENWGRTRPRTRSTSTGLRERVHSEIGAGALPSGVYFWVSSVHAVALQSFSHQFALETARDRSSRV